MSGAVVLSRVPARNYGSSVGVGIDAMDMYRDMKALAGRAMKLPKYVSKGDTLRPGESLFKGEALTTKNGGVLLMQDQGNLVLYRPMGQGVHAAIWWSQANPTNAVRATMPKSGGLVLSTPGGGWEYEAPTSAHGSTRLVLQEDGNLVWYDAKNKALLSTETNGWWVSPGLRPKRDSTLTALAKVVTAPITAPAQAIAKVTKDIPVIGDVTRIASNAVSSPANMIVSIASGARIDQAVMQHFKDQIQTIKDVAPYVQTVISFVPGIGTGVAAAMAAGAALVQGKPIDEVLKSAVRGAIPGGAVAVAAFDTAMKVAAGGNVAQAVLEGARNALPDGPAKKAFDIGLAVVTGQNMQEAIVEGLVSMAPDTVKSLINTGKSAIGSSRQLTDALASVIGKGGAPAVLAKAQEGFQLASGLLAQAGINQKAIDAVRNKLPADAAKGFDAALRSQEARLPWIGEVVSKAPDPAANVRAMAERVARIAKEAQKPPAMRAAPAPATKPPAMRAAPQPVTKGKPTSPAAAAPAASPAPAPTPVVAPAALPQAAAQMAPAGPQTPVPGVFPPYPQTSQVGTLGGCDGAVDGFWGDVIHSSAMPKAMVWAGRSAVNGSRGAPRKVQSPDGRTFLFQIDRAGRLTARPAIPSKAAPRPAQTAAAAVARAVRPISNVFV